MSIIEQQEVVELERRVRARLSEHLDRASSGEIRDMVQSVVWLRQQVLMEEPYSEDSLGLPGVPGMVISH